MQPPDRVRRVAAGVVMVVIVALVLTIVVPAAVLAAEPSPTTAAAGDPRSAGEGPGLVGDPLWAIGIVVAIAVISLGVSLAYVRATARRDEPPA